MIKAIKSGDKEIARQLSEASGDKILFDLLSRIDVGHGRLLEVPDDAAIARYAAIPLASVEPKRGPVRRGRLAFDSWATAAAPALRDTTAGHVRRFRLAAGAIALEVVAERLQDGWDFVARVYKKEEVSSEYALSVNRQRYLPESQGFYHWSSRTVPRHFALLSPDTSIEFEEIQW